MDNFLKSVIHYYHGTPFKYSNDYDNTIIFGTCGYFVPWFIIGKTHADKDFEIEEPLNNGKLQLILRNAWDENSTQCQKRRELCHKVKDAANNILIYADTPLSLHYGFQNSFDMFDLIEKGFAIDVMTLEKSLREWAIQQQTLKREYL